MRIGNWTPALTLAGVVLALALGGSASAHRSHEEKSAAKSEAGCNGFGCWEARGGCNGFGCWKNDGGCNGFGCWNSPIGACNGYGCSDFGTCNGFGCPKASSVRVERREVHEEEASTDTQHRVCREGDMVVELSTPGCNGYGCWEAGGGCNGYGCWKQGGGCNGYGCWNSFHGSCNGYGCSDVGACGGFGCPKGAAPALRCRMED